MGTTISGLSAAARPLTGAEVLPADVTQGGQTDRFATADVAALAELYAMAHLGARPERLDAAATHFTTQGAGDPLAVWFPPAVTSAAGYGPVYQAAGQMNLWTRGTVPAGPDKVYEVEAEVAQVSVGGGESPVFRVGLRSLDGSYADTDGTPNAVSPVSSVMAAGLVRTFRWRFGGANITEEDQWADTAAALNLRPFVDVNLKSDLSGYVTSSVAQVRRLLVRDVTHLVEAANFLFCTTGA
jgi:hypothetical protein